MQQNQQEFQLSQTQQKNQQFKSQIRRKLKLDIMSKMRRQFIIMEQSTNANSNNNINGNNNPNNINMGSNLAHNYNISNITGQPPSLNKRASQIQSLTVQNLQMLVNKSSPTSQNIGTINRIIIEKRNQISRNKQLLDKILLFLKVNFINWDADLLAVKPQLNDLIALLGNFLSFGDFYQDDFGGKQVNLQQQKNQQRLCLQFKQTIKRQIDLINIFNKLYLLLEIGPLSSGALILWIIYQITDYTSLFICKQSQSQQYDNNYNIENQRKLQAQQHKYIIQKLSQNQRNLVQKFTISEINLTYILVKVMDYNPKLIDPQIIVEYTLVTIDQGTSKYFCENIIIIFDMFIRQYTKNVIKNQYIQSILRWIIYQFLSKKFPPQSKTNLLKILYNIISCNINFNFVLLSSFINQQNIIYQLIQNSLYNTLYENKITSLKIINLLIKILPKFQLQQLINNFPTIIDTIVHSFSLNQYEIVIESLKSITRIVMQCGGAQAVYTYILASQNLKFQLESLAYCQNKQIANLSNILLEEYFD